MTLEQYTSVPSLPVRPADGHKGTFGRVLVVGGNEGMIGAPALAGTAALRLGSGLVQIAVPRSILIACLQITPELIGVPLSECESSPADDEPLLDAAGHADALIVGPGLGQSPLARQRVEAFVQLSKPMVFDADALNILATGKTWPADFNAHAVLTPHPGEMRRLARLIGRGDVPADDAGRVELAHAAAVAFGQVIVLKGHRTVVCDATRVHINDTGDSSLSKAGAGDVLSGLIGCLLGQKMERFDAAVAAVHLHGRCGELAGQKLGKRSVLARDIIDVLPQAIAEAEQAAATSSS